MMSSATEYGIGIVKNRFALSGIEEEVDPLELLKRHELERETRKKSKVVEKISKSKEVAKPKILKSVKESHSKPSVDVIQKDVLKLRQKDSGVIKKHVTIVDDNFKNEKEDFQELHGETEGEERREYNTGSAFDSERGKNNKRGLSRGVFVRGGGRGGFRGYPRTTFDSRGKREYDRQSGSDKTGIKPIDKREGSGAHNWGSIRDFMDTLPTAFSAEEDNWNSEKVEEQPIENNEAVVEETDNTGIVKVEEEEEEEKKELTLDEWKALKTPRKTPTYNIRKAGEGEDLSQWKKMYALQKKKEAEIEDYELEFGDYPQRVGRQKKLDIDIHFKDTRNLECGGRGRGTGRGGGGGIGGYQAGRGSFSPRQNAPATNNRTLVPAPKVDDERDFPSLA